MPKIVCPACEVPFETSHPPGTVATCPGCGQEMEVPGPGAASRFMSDAREGLSKWREGRKARKAERAKESADRRARQQAPAQTAQATAPPKTEPAPLDPLPASEATLREVLTALKWVRREQQGMGFRVFCGVLLALIVFSILSAIVGVGCLGLARR